MGADGALGPQGHSGRGPLCQRQDPRNGSRGWCWCWGILGQERVAAGQLGWVGAHRATPSASLRNAGILSSARAASVVRVGFQRRAGGSGPAPMPCKVEALWHQDPSPGGQPAQSVSRWSLPVLSPGILPPLSSRLFPFNLRQAGLSPFCRWEQVQGGTLPPACGSPCPISSSFEWEWVGVLTWGGGTWASHRTGCPCTGAGPEEMPRPALEGLPGRGEDKAGNHSVPTSGSRIFQGLRVAPDW